MSKAGTTKVSKAMRNSKLRRVDSLRVLMFRRFGAKKNSVPNNTVGISNGCNRMDSVWANRVFKLGVCLECLKHKSSENPLILVMEYSGKICDCAKLCRD